MHYQRLQGSGALDLIKKFCTLDGCGKVLYREGFCRTHWARWNEYGDPRHVRKCSVEGCPKVAPSGKRGWCTMHYTRWYKRGSVGEIAPRIFQPPREPVDGHQWCTTCRTERPLEEFRRDTTTRNGLTRVCRECLKDQRVALDYGISAEVYRQMLDEQAHACLICRKPETSTHQSGTRRRLAVDHDHRCCPGKKSCGKCIRGLLCARCNSAIGLVNEDLEVIESMAQYLSR